MTALFSVHEEMRLYLRAPKQPYSTVDLGYVYMETILKRKRKGGVALSPFILRLDKRFG